MLVKSQNAANAIVSSEKKKVGTRTTGGAVFVAGAALLESAAAQQKCDSNPRHIFRWLYRATH